MVCTHRLVNICHPISHSKADHPNLFFEQLTWRSFLEPEYSNKQLPLTGSGNNVRNFTPKTVFQRASLLSLWLLSSEGRGYQPSDTQFILWFPPESSVWF